MSAPEDRARAAKAFDLARAFEAEFAKVAPSGQDTPELLARLARDAGPGVWAMVAELHGIRPPSPSTVAVAIGILEAGARAAGDPFNGVA